MTQSCPNISLTQFKKPIRDCYLMMHDVGGKVSLHLEQKKYHLLVIGMLQVELMLTFNLNIKIDEVKLELCDEEIEWVKKIKYLGVWIDAVKSALNTQRTKGFLLMLTCGQRLVGAHNKRNSHTFIYSLGLFIRRVFLLFAEGALARPATQ
ncbi:hypothetical protein BpHYR1_041946 [Brachionus plicatilis]|uniref:Uncharacterized protein n=1 Tax=Brachionus plicatilis TaxID=10195 RepID=A0A3M7PRC8_BRAPC|nr:hypothetical protein BpHYR1_041946 [Brachionus plicatilis]